MGRKKKTVLYKSMNKGPKPKNPEAIESFKECARRSARRKGIPLPDKEDEEK